MDYELAILKQQERAIGHYYPQGRPAKTTDTFEPAPDTRTVKQMHEANKYYLMGHFKYLEENQK